MARRTICHPEALDRMTRAVRELGTAAGFEQACLAIAAQGRPDEDPDRVTAVLDGFALRLRDRVPPSRLPSFDESGAPESPVEKTSAEPVMAHLHALLFEEAGFRGAPEDYYNPANSFLTEVVETRRGIPVTLAAVYKLVAARVGLPVHGLNAPWHFLAAVDAHDGRVIVDVFNAGRVVTPEEIALRLEEADEIVPPDPADLLPVATHRDWALRIIQNLLGIYAHQGRDRDVHAFLELRACLLAIR